MLKVASLKAAIAYLDRSPRGSIVGTSLEDEHQRDAVPVLVTRQGGDILWMPHPGATYVEGHGEWERLPQLKPHTLGHNLRSHSHMQGTWNRYRYPSPPPMFDDAMDDDRDGSSVSHVEMGDWYAVGARVQNGQQRAPEGEATPLSSSAQLTPNRHRSRQGSRSVQSIESRQSHSEDIVEVRRARRRELEAYVRANYGYPGGINYTAAAHDFSKSYVTVTEADLRRALAKGSMFSSYDKALPGAHAKLVAQALDDVLPLAFITDF